MEHAVRPAPLSVLPDLSPDDRACLAFLEALAPRYRLFCAKAYRVNLVSSGLPLIPCLDHEAQLQGTAPPHTSVYLEDSSGDLHEVGLVPSLKRVTVDAASTFAETEPAARARMVAELRQLFPTYTVQVQAPSFYRGDRRVAGVVRSQIRLREVLSGSDAAALRWKLEKLRAIADLMEKESRVSSWSVRTLTPLVLGAAGVMLYAVLQWSQVTLAPETVELVRYAALTGIGGTFLVIGLKAVHLTEMGTRVWKRATEYKLILDARQKSG
jgi:hypothetical protein